ncbi:hypothetical protein DIJ64_14715 [Mycobacterium leprae]|uniref:Uncharacterized protein n=1 Tax=Mycobacterium leprae TaxID=1769 RepID=A0AAD0KXD5_MYCLR|nr:hypothetical protein DIJ64_14715 [Mycobacterium leprae]
MTGRIVVSGDQLFWAKLADRLWETPKSSLTRLASTGYIDFRPFGSAVHHRSLGRHDRLGGEMFIYVRWKTRSRSITASPRMRS